MKFYQETTNWKDDIPNGIYLLNDSKTKMYAFVKAGSHSVFHFKNPIQIDSRGRTFKIVTESFGVDLDSYNEPTANPKWEVMGSKGDKYIVEKTENGLTCTCTGFKFRGKCKHLDISSAK